ncbi:MAG: flagellar protein FlaG [Treponema sp.]|jgi:flagellar protein FlaG|nr:flagellar protein FlaG [Treponema sp.]
MSIAIVGHTPAPSTQFSGDIRAQTARQETRPQVIQIAAADLQRISQTFSNKKLQYVVDHGSNQVVVKVIDKETDKVIKELPPEELQRLHKNLKEASGALFDEMA